MVFTPGMRLADRYLLDARIGRGGMSEVWRATDELLGRPVAVKALASPLAADPAMRSGVRQEARAAARLTHPNVTQVYDYGEATVGDGTLPYLVMELVDGQNLADRLSHGPLPWRDAVQVAAQVAAGLAAAHHLNVVHRDIKPGNVMLTPNGAKILDFGIATPTGARPEAEAGWLIGTPAYAAPERLRAGVADPAGDVYALGALLHEAVTGRTPIIINSWAEAAAAHERPAQFDPPRAPGLPADVAALCLGCLAADPADRPRAGDLATRLAAAVGAPSAGPTGVAAATLPAAHPPTLIDRSLTAPPPAPSPRGVPPMTPRIAGSAAVVHRPPASGQAMTWQPDGRPGRSRLLIVAVAGAIVAAGLTLALIASAFNTGPSAPSAGAGPSTTGVGAPPARTTEPPPRPTPTTGEEIVAELDHLITEAVAADQMTGKAAKELRDKLEDVSKKLDDRKGKSVRGEANSLLEKIEKLVEEGEISDATVADQMVSTLRPLLFHQGRGNGGDDD